MSGMTNLRTINLRCLYRPWGAQVVKRAVTPAVEKTGGPARNRQVNERWEKSGGMGLAGLFWSSGQTGAGRCKVTGE